VSEAVAQKLNLPGRVVLTALTLLPILAIALATSMGPGISVDSVSYAAAAKSWAESGLLLGYDGRDLSIFPVGLPVLVGSLMATGLSLSAAVTLPNLVATGLIVLAAYFLGRQVLMSPGWALMAALLVSLAVSTVRVGSYFWTEPVFTALVSWALVATAWGIRRRSDSWWLALAVGALVSVATSFRYVGIALQPVLVLGIAWSSHSRRLLRGLLVLGIGSLGLLLSAGRNLWIGAPALGERYPGSVDSQGAVLGLVKLWGEYLAPSSTTSLTVVFGAVVLVLLVAGIWLVLIARNRPGILVAGIVIVYWSAILVSQVGTRLDVATERFGAPVLAASVVLVLAAIRSLLGTVSRQIEESTSWNSNLVHQGVAGAAVLVLVGVLGISLLHTVRFVSDGRPNGLGLDSAAAADRSVSRIAQALPAGTVIASNDPWQVWWIRGEGPVLDLPPSRNEWPADRVQADLDRLALAVREEGSVVVLLDEGSRASISVEDLASQGLVVSEIGQQSGVEIWELTRER
jgi:hypothetical protein